MALYRINRRNTLFQGLPGDFVRAEPDPIMDAAVKAGIISRWDTEEPAKPEKPEKTDSYGEKTTRKKKARDNDGSEDKSSGDQENP